MATDAVEWVLVISYNISAHRATYGRFNGTKDKTYTKDYIQLSRKPEFIKCLKKIFGVSDKGSVSLTYLWPSGRASGDLVMQSADRPHLKWDTKSDAPAVWKMALKPSNTTAESIPGNPDHKDPVKADAEHDNLSRLGLQPYLLAIKLKNEPHKLHLRVYFENAPAPYSWADSKYLPNVIRGLFRKTSSRSAIAWCELPGGGIMASPRVKKAIDSYRESKDITPIITNPAVGVGHELVRYLENPGHGLFFDPSKNHDAWQESEAISSDLADDLSKLLASLKDRFPVLPVEDAVAERLESDPGEVEVFQNKIKDENYDVPDETTTVKTRGSAQKAFADAVKKYYGWKCAVTGISTRDFLVASHVVPWSVDQKIRLDPCNGICLSLIVDRAFEKGYLVILDDYTITINEDKIGKDDNLKRILAPYAGKKLDTPKGAQPKKEYLARRRELVAKQ